MEPGAVQPGKVLRPRMTLATATQLAERLYGLRVKSVRELDSCYDRNYLLMTESVCDNPHLKVASADGYVLKVLNSGVSKSSRVEAEHQVQALLLKEGFNVPVPVLNVHGSHFSHENIAEAPTKGAVVQETGPSHKVHIVRMLTYRPGIPLCDANIPYSASLLYEVGKYIGHFDHVTKVCDHTSLDGTGSVGLQKIPELWDFQFAVADQDHRKLITDVLTAFCETVVPLMDVLPKGLIHGDFHSANIIVKEKPKQGDQKPDEREYGINTVIDFGDMTNSCYVFELAICIAHFMMDANAAGNLESVGHIIAGYLTEMELSDLEWQVLKECAEARSAAVMMMVENWNQLQPENREYVEKVTCNGWRGLQMLRSTPKGDLLKIWKDVAYRK